MSELTSVFDARQGWADDGSRNAADWLAVRCRLPRPQAASEVRAARHLGTMDGTPAAWGAGDLTPAHVLVLTRLAGHPRAGEHFPEGEALLVEMAVRATTAPADGKRPAPLVTVVVDLETLAGRVCELASGTVVAPGDIAQLLGRDETLMQRVVFDGPNRIRDISTARSFRGTLRRVLNVVHRRCDHPSCFVPSHWCQGDHVLPWSEGGPTSQQNGPLGCPFHNRWWYEQRSSSRPRAQADALPPPSGSAPRTPMSPPVRVRLAPSSRRARCRAPAPDEPDLLDGRDWRSVEGAAPLGLTGGQGFS